MSTLSDILALLDRWPIWKAIKESPDRIAALERRVADLEAKPRAQPSTGVTIPCPLCGKPMKITKVMPHDIFGSTGVQQREFACECGHNESRWHDPNKD